MPRRLRWRLAIACVLVLTGRATAGLPQLIELTTSSGPLFGKSVIHNDKVCWMAERDGTLHEVPIATIERVQKVSDRFRAYSVAEMRDLLRREARDGMEVTAVGRYVVSAPKGTAERYAKILDDTHTAFSQFFSRRNFQLDPLEFPLVVRVFPSRLDFIAYATSLQISVPDSLVGFYHRRTNQIALFAEQATLGGTVLARPVSAALGGTRSGASDIHQATIDTLIHEAIHQLAFNTGLHSRIGDPPRWVVEGLAMLLEEESSRTDSRNGPASLRMNRSRFIRFMNYREQRRPAKHLSEFVTSGASFEGLPLDEYAEAWALSFYLFETRPSEYSRYLRTTAARDPLSSYDAATRLADFEAAFGKDLDRLEAQYLTFIQRLENSPR
ncbi:MAG: DUF1570 domain-containing protein [Planctomycetaceae bacterium]